MGNYCFGNSQNDSIVSFGIQGKLDKAVFKNQDKMTRAQYEEFRAGEVANMDHSENVDKDTIPLHQISYELYLTATVTLNSKMTLCHSYPDPSELARSGAERQTEAGAAMPGALAGYRVGQEVQVTGCDPADTHTPFKILLPVKEESVMLDPSTGEVISRAVSNEIPRDKWMGANHLEHFNKEANDTMEQVKLKERQAEEEKLKAEWIENRNREEEFERQQIERAQNRN